jgi:antitoxin component of RelBE/YafQ-DinJ toxin-antitoxin module
MSYESINLTTDAELLSKAQAKVSELGIDMNTVFNVLLKRLVNDEVAPIEEKECEKIEPKNTFYKLYGKLKGQIWVADDFDAPLEEFKEYME